jgi:hypothetical protein
VHREIPEDHLLQLCSPRAVVMAQSLYADLRGMDEREKFHVLVANRDPRQAILGIRTGPGCACPPEQLAVRTNVLSSVNLPYRASPDIISDLAHPRIMVWP